MSDVIDWTVALDSQQLEEKAEDDYDEDEYEDDYDDPYSYDDQSMSTYDVTARLLEINAALSLQVIPAVVDRSDSVGSSPSESPSGRNRHRRRVRFRDNPVAAEIPPETHYDKPSDQDDDEEDEEVEEEDEDEDDADDGYGDSTEVSDEVDDLEAKTSSSSQDNDDDSSSKGPFVVSTSIERLAVTLLTELMSTEAIRSYLDRPSEPQGTHLKDTDTDIAVIVDEADVVKQQQPGVDGQKHDVNESPQVTELKPEVTDVKLDVTELKPEVTDVKLDVTELKPEVTDVKLDVTELKPEATDVKLEVTVLKAETTEQKQELVEINENAAEQQPEVTEMKHEAAELRQQVPERRQQQVIKPNWKLAKQKQKRKVTNWSLSDRSMVAEQDSTCHDVRLLGTRSWRQFRCEPTRHRQQPPPSSSSSSSQTVEDTTMVMSSQGKFHLINMADIGTKRTTSLPRMSDVAKKWNSSSSNNNNNNNRHEGRVQSTVSHTAGPRLTTHLVSSRCGHGQTQVRPKTVVAAGRDERVTRSTSSNKSAAGGYGLTPEQKQERQRRLSELATQRRLDQDRAQEEAKQKKERGDLAFREWLRLKKKDATVTVDDANRSPPNKSMTMTAAFEAPSVAFGAWLHRKRLERLEERRLRELGLVYERALLCRKSREENERAFRNWLATKTRRRIGR